MSEFELVAEEEESQSTAILRKAGVSRRAAFIRIVAKLSDWLWSHRRCGGKPERPPPLHPSPAHW